MRFFPFNMLNEKTYGDAPQYSQFDISVPITSTQVMRILLNSACSNDSLLSKSGGTTNGHSGLTTVSSRLCTRSNTKLSKQASCRLILFTSWIFPLFITIVLLKNTKTHSSGTHQHVRLVSGACQSAACLLIDRGRFFLLPVSLSIFYSTAAAAVNEFCSIFRKRSVPGIKSYSPSSFINVHIPHFLQHPHS